MYSALVLNDREAQSCLTSNSNVTRVKFDLILKLALDSSKKCNHMKKNVD